MQRARCSAANVYDVSSAVQNTFGRISGSQCLKRADSNGAYAFNTTRTQRPATRRTGGTTPRRLYTTAPKHEQVSSAANKPADELSESEHRRLQKLAFYDMAAQLQGEEDSGQGIATAPKDEQYGRPAIVDWSIHMTELSRRIREQRSGPSQASSDAPEDNQALDHAQSTSDLESLDYEGLAIPLKRRNVAFSTPIPWVPDHGKRKRNLTAAQTLDYEITAFAKHMSLTASEKNNRKAVLYLAKGIISHSTDFKVEEAYNYGSFRTGIAMPYSDIDIGIDTTEHSPERVSHAMSKLYDRLNHSDDFICVVHRPGLNAIITAQHKSTGIDVQIMVKQGKFHPQDSRVIEHLRNIPNLHKLYMVVRTALGIRGLVDPYIGGISAYGTFMMLVAALTRRGTPSEIHGSPSTQLMHFLSFWSDFDTTRRGITIGWDGFVKPFMKIPINKSDVSEEILASERLAFIEAARRRKDSQRAGQYRIGRVRPRQPYLLCLQDPARAINDLGAGCHAIKHILQTLKSLHQELLHSMAAHGQSTQADTADAEEAASLLLPLVGRSHEYYSDRRQRVTDPKIISIKQDIKPSTIKKNDERRYQRSSVSSKTSSHPQ